MFQRTQSSKKNQDARSHAAEISDAGVLDQEEQQKRWELEMQKMASETKEKSSRNEARQGTLVAGLIIPTGTIKKWSLEDGDD